MDTPSSIESSVSCSIERIRCWKWKLFFVAEWICETALKLRGERYKAIVWGLRTSSIAMVCLAKTLLVRSIADEIEILGTLSDSTVSILKYSSFHVSSTKLLIKCASLAGI